jgi:hypothetical protein
MLITLRANRDSFATLAAIRRASSLVKNLADDRVSPPKGKPNWEGVSSEERARWLAAYDRYDGLKNTFQEPKYHFGHIPTRSAHVRFFWVKRT